MRKIIAALFALYLLGPAFAFADTAIPLQPSVAQLLTRAAALEALEAMSATSSLACAALTNVSTVRVNQPFILAWGSVGAIGPSASSTVSRWPIAGASSITQQTPGTWMYRFSFDGQQGGSATCTARITVTSA